MSNDEFTKLFRHINGRSDTIDKKLENTSTKDDVRRILSQLDSMEKQLDISEDERLVMGHQLDRLNRWIHEVAVRSNASS
jgi:hypothetical protein